MVFTTDLFINEVRARSILETKSNLVYLIEGKGFKDYDNNKNGNLYIKIVK